MSDAVSDLERLLLAQIPLARAMELRIRDYDGDHLAIAAPLAPNINDKGCAFGGSLVALMTLAGWALVENRLQAAGLHADVFVADSQVEYLAPLWDDLTADAAAAEGEDWDAFLAAFAQKGRARIAVLAEVPLPQGGVATRLRARYVAVAKG